MSLILEALKKSEAQRQLGEMPNLGTPISATRRRRSPMPWLALTVVVALAAVGGWEFLQHRSAPAPVAGQPAANKPTPGAAPPPLVAQRQPKPPVSAPANQTITSIPPPAPPAAAKKETAPPPPPPVPVRTAAEPNTPPATPAAAPTPPATPTPEPAAPVAAAPAPAPAPPANDVPTIDDLPPDVRGALPALPISMQVYSPDPKRRFVIIDGTRVAEGDSLRGVTVQEIRPSGLVIDFRGRRVLLPRPGT